MSSDDGGCAQTADRPGGLNSGAVEGATIGRIRDRLSNLRLGVIKQEPGRAAEPRIDLAGGLGTRGAHGNFHVNSLC